MIEGAGSSTFQRVRGIATTVFIAVALYWVLNAFVVGTYRVEGHSMDDSLHNGQRLLVDKLTIRFDPYHRGDIVVLHAPGNAESATPYIKRVIGVAGDHVQVRDGSVWLNGTELDEPYVRRGAVTRPTTGVSSWDVGPGQLLVMGDNRNRSQDSRMFGTVAVDEIIGRAWLSIWPLNTIGILQSPSYPDQP
jgi:signal peptidase I